MLAYLDKLSSWSVAATYAAFCALAGVLVRGLLRRSLTAIAKARETEWSEVLATSLPRPAGAGVFLVLIAAGLRTLPPDTLHLRSANKVISVTVALLGVGVLMRVAMRAIDAFGRSNPGLRSSAGIGKAVTWVVGLSVAAVLVCDALGVSLAPALTALGVGSLAVALALQDTLTNFFSGLYIVVDKPVRPGDFIRVDPTYEGYVESIGWRSTHLRTLAHNLVILPNATLSKAIITNYSRPTPRVASSIRVDVAPDADLDRVEDALADEARRSADIPGIAAAPAAGVAMAPGFLDGAVGFTVSFHVVSFEEQGNVQHALRKRVAARLRREGVELASPRIAVVRRADGGPGGPGGPPEVNRPG